MPVGVVADDLAARVGAPIELVVLAAAEASGIARWCLDTAVEYAKVREQFGRPIGSFQAIKHLCAEMLETSESVTAAAWDAARAAVDNLAATARSQLRPVYGSQDSAFAAALPGLPRDRKATAAYGLWFARSLAEPSRALPPPGRLMSMARISCTFLNLPVVFPTDTVYGVGVTPFEPTAPAFVTVTPPPTVLKQLYLHTDDRNFVKKAVNWALRQIGKRNVTLHPKALQLAQELAQSGNKTALGKTIVIVEPLPAQSALWDMPKVVVTAHNAGDSPGYGPRWGALFQQNLAALHGVGEWINRVGARVEATS